MMMLVALHLAANLFWIGSIASVGVVLGQAARREDGRAIAQAALSLYRRVAVPALLASLAFGTLRLAMEPSYYLHLHWFHAKLTAVVPIIGLHHWIGAMAKRAAAGSVQAGRNGAIVSVGLSVCAFAVVVLVVYRRALVP